MQNNNRIYEVIREDNMVALAELIDKDPKLLQSLTTVGTLLHYAASYGKTEFVKQLVALGADVNIQAGVYETGALKGAANNGHLEVVKYLFSCGAELDVSEPQKNPLFGAITNGHVEIASFLIASGLDVRVKYQHDLDALTYAKRKGQLEIVRLIEEETRLLILEEPCGEVIVHATDTYGRLSDQMNEFMFSGAVPLSVNVISPSEQSSFTTLFTTGAGDFAAEGSVVSKPQYAELLLKLSPGWSYVQRDLDDPLVFWPFDLLSKLSDCLRLNRSDLYEGIIISSDDLLMPFIESMDFYGALIIADTKLDSLVTSDGQVVCFYSVIFLYEEEMVFALENGYKALLGLLNANGISDVFQFDRKNVCLGEYREVGANVH